ncbi:MAG TPA: YihY/virulence factor BrkB family protein [Blastocatellia bacterium]|nr:YihY/virulence factor BrkB family protein [Blastocatellia bacterium]
MSSRVFGGLKLKELAIRTWKESNEDNVFGRAAELAYYFLLALFPMLIFLTSLVAFLPGAQENIIGAIGKAAPPQVMEVVRQFMHDVVENRSGGLLSFGVLATLWAASNGVSAVMDTLNTAYDAKEGRSFIKKRIVAIGLTMTLSVLVVGGTVLIMFGDRFAEWLGGALGLGSAFTTAWKVLDYIIGLGLLFLGIQLIYYLGPNVKQRWHWITPGAVFAVAGLILSSLAFSFYLRYAPDYSATYGSLGAVIILMLWLYIMGLVLLVGGEINSEIRLASGKPTVERENPGQLQAA